jgi:hypothetical protein
MPEDWSAGLICINRDGAGLVSCNKHDRSALCPEARSRSERLVIHGRWLALQ